VIVLGACVSAVHRRGSRTASARRQAIASAAPPRSVISTEEDHS
jgi:hypothetical protein